MISFFDALRGRTPALDLVTPEEALPGRGAPVLRYPAPHMVLGTSIVGPWPPGTRVLYLAMGCFWGAEEIFWQIPGVVSTAVGYMGGITPNPTYEEVCTSRTGHTETAMVAYDPLRVQEITLLAAFWERHDPTTGYRQGNDVGTQYRSAVYWTMPEQAGPVRASATTYGSLLESMGYGSLTTDLRPAMEAGPFYYAEDNHQQYLAKNPNGYRCHASTGVRYPLPAQQ